MDTPTETNFFTDSGASKPQQDNTKYRRAIGILLYISTVKRSDTVTAVGRLCRNVNASSVLELQSN